MTDRLGGGGGMWEKKALFVSVRGSTRGKETSIAERDKKVVSKHSSCSIWLYKFGTRRAPSSSTSASTSNMLSW